MKMRSITPLFLDSIPQKLEEGKLYISLEDEVAQHKCCCGCGDRIVTPLTPAGWTIYVNRQSIVTLRPSIGNGQGRCKSHYFITRNQIDWLGNMTPHMTAMAQARDKRDMKRYIAEKNIARGMNGRSWNLLDWLKRLFGF